MDGKYKSPDLIHIHFMGVFMKNDQFNTAIYKIYSSILKKHKIFIFNDFLKKYVKKKIGNKNLIIELLTTKNFSIKLCKKLMRDDSVNQFNSVTDRFTEAGKMKKPKGYERALIKIVTNNINNMVRVEFEKKYKRFKTKI